MVLKDNNLEIELLLIFWSSLHLSNLQMTKCYPHPKEGRYTYLNKFTNLETIILWFFGKLCNLRQQCHNHIFHMKSDPSTHVQLKIWTTYV